MRIYLYLFLYVLAFSSNAQPWEWAKNYTFGSQNSGVSIGTDNASNIYVGNGFSSAFLKCDPSGNILTTYTPSIGGYSATDDNGNTYFANANKIAKYNNSGIELWNVTSDIPNAYFTDIELHPLGDIVIVGWTVSNNSKSIFCRYDNNGNLIWEKIGEFFPGGEIIKCDKLGNLYIVGEYSQDTVTHNYGFIVKYDNTGNIIYNKSIPASVNGIAFDNNNNFYTGGWFSALPLYIEGNVYSSSSNNPVPQFLIKYDPNCNVLWYKIINGDLGRGGIATDKNGNIYLTNSYSTLIMDTINLTAEYNNAANLFIMKADSAGTILWYKHSVANVSGAGVSTGAIYVSDNEDIYITGSMSKTNTFDSYTLTQTSTYSDLLIAKISQTNTTAVSPVIQSEKEGGLYVFPNPASNSVTINFSSSVKGNLILNITNELGQTVYTENKKDFSGEYANTIDLENQPAGIYFVKILADTRSATQKIVLK